MIAGMARESITPMITRPECVSCHGQREHRDIVEIVADFADHLAHPGVAIIAVAAKQLEKFAHQCRLLWVARCLVDKNSVTSGVASLGM